MADIAGTYSMPTDPVVRHTVSYETKRSGTTISYRFRVSVAPINGASWFGYNLYCSIVLNAQTVLSGGSLKDNLPDQWGSPIVKYFPSSTGWYTVSVGSDRTTLPAYLSFGSNSGNSTNTGEKTVSVPAASPPTPPNIYLSASTILPTDRVTLGVRGGSGGDAGLKGYHYWYRIKGKSWQTITFGPSSTISFSPADFGATYGTVGEVCAATISNYNVESADSEYITLTCASKPGTPTNFAISPSPMRRNDTITLSWTAPSAGSGSISGYIVNVRYHDGSGWSDWILNDSTTSPPFTTTPSRYKDFEVAPRGRLQYSVKAQNSYGLQSPEATAEVLIKGGLAAIKVGGAWKNDGQAFVKVNDAWKEADAVYIKTNGTWKEQA